MDITNTEYWKTKLSKSESVNQQPKEWYKDINIPKDYSFNKAEEPEELTPISALVKSNFAFSSEVKMKIYAKARGIDPSKYSMQNGEIVFKGDDNKIYKEEASGVIPGIRKFSIEMLSDPTTYLTGGAGFAARKIGASTAKVIASEVGASIGAELLRQKIGEKAFDDKMSTSQKALNIGTTVALGLGIEGAARGGKKLIGKASDLIRSKNSTKIAKILSNTGALEKEAIKTVSEIQNNAKKFGIELTLPEASDNLQVRQLFNTLSSGKQALPIVEKEIQRSSDIEKRVPEFMKSYFPDWLPQPEKKLTSLREGFQIRKAVQDEIRGLDIERSNITKPFYEAAFSKNPIIDTDPIIKTIDSFMDTGINEKKTALKKIKKNLFTKKTIQENNEIKTVLDPTMNLAKLDEQKKYLDKLLYSREPADSWAKVISSELSDIRTQLVNTMDEISPEYKRARQVHSLLTIGKENADLSKPENIKYAMKGEKRLRTIENLQTIADMPDNELQSAFGYILSTSKSSPEVIKQVKNVVLNQENGKQIWENSIADYVMYNFDNINIKKDVPQKIGADLYNSLFGTKQKKEALVNALDPLEYKNFYDFFEILRRTDLTRMPTISIEKGDLKSELSIPLLRVVKPLVTTQALAADAISKLYGGQNLDQLIKVLIDPNIAPKLTAMKNIKNNDILLNEIISILSFNQAQNLTQDMNQ